MLNFLESSYSLSWEPEAMFFYPVFSLLRQPCLEEVWCLQKGRDFGVDLEILLKWFSLYINYEGQFCPIILTNNHTSEFLLIARNIHLQYSTAPVSSYLLQDGCIFKMSKKKHISIIAFVVKQSMNGNEQL